MFFFSIQFNQCTKFCTDKCISTPGISDWGANFVHFSHYDTWNEGIIDHFLVMIKLLFSKQLQMGTAGALSQLGGSSVSIVR